MTQSSHNSTENDRPQAIAVGAVLEARLAVGRGDTTDLIMRVIVTSAHIMVYSFLLSYECGNDASLLSVKEPRPEREETLQRDVDLVAGVRSSRCSLLERRDDYMTFVMQPCANILSVSL